MSNTIRIYMWRIIPPPHAGHTIQYNTWSEHWAPGRHRTHIHIHVRRWLAVADLLGVNLPGFGGGGGQNTHLDIIPGITVSAIASANEATQ
jgi:hypothetical protein